MMSSKLLLISLIVGGALGLGCGSNLRPDPALSADKAKYPTGEILVGGQLWNGLAMVVIDQGQPYDSVGLHIQTYYNGTVSVLSKNCELDHSFRYEGSQLIRYQIPGVALRNCLLTIVKSPEYPNESNQSLVISPMRSHVAIRVKNGERWVGTTAKLYDGERKIWYARVMAPSSYIHGNSTRVVLDGCGKQYDKILPVNINGYVEIELSEAVDTSKVTVCVMEGVAFFSKPRPSPIEAKTLLNALISVHITEVQGKKFTPLPDPYTSIERGKIKVTADEAVSITSLDKKYEIDREGEFDFDQNKKHVLRLITVGGRLWLGVYDPGMGWEFLQ